MAKKKKTDPTHSDEVVALDTLTLFPGNPRTHGEKQLNELRRSLEMFGQFRPLVIDEAGVVLAGNGMLDAMRSLGWETGKATRISGMTEAEKKKLVLADNRIAGMGFTDYEAVDLLLAEIADTAIPGYDEDFLKQMLASAEEVLAEAESYGVFDDEELEGTQKAEGIYRGESIPQHLQARNLDEAAGNDDDDDKERPTPPAGAEAQVCKSCGRPW